MKPADELQADGARIVIRPLDVAIPYEKSLVIESTVKVRRPDRSWPNTGLSPSQRQHRDYMEAFVDVQDTLVADYVRPGREPGTSVVLGFITYGPAYGAVTMLYVKRDFRGFGIGARLLGGTGVPGDPRVLRAEGWQPNECWRRWKLYHERHVVVRSRGGDTGPAEVDVLDVVIDNQARMAARAKRNRSRHGP